MLTHQSKNHRESRAAANNHTSKNVSPNHANPQGVAQRYVRAGYVPGDGKSYTLTDYTSAYSVGHPNGGERFSQPRKVDAVNQSFAKGKKLTFPSFDQQISDASSDGLVAINDASKLAPEVDHIVEKANGGSNHLSNARVVSKSENNNGVPPRPSKYSILSGNEVAIKEVQYDQSKNSYMPTTHPQYKIMNKAIMSDQDIEMLMAVSDKKDLASVKASNFNYSKAHLDALRKPKGKEVNTNSPVDKGKYLRIHSIS